MSRVLVVLALFAAYTTYECPAQDRGMSSSPAASAFEQSSAETLFAAWQLLGEAPPRSDERATECPCQCTAGYPCTTNGFISYNGTYVDSVGRFVPWIELLEYWPTYRYYAFENFVDMRDRFHATGVRLILHPSHHEWAHAGLEFPTPTPTEISNLRNVLDTAKLAGLEVILVPLPPKEYRPLSPTLLDNGIYVNNNLELRTNLYTWWDSIVGSVLYTVDPWGEPRINNVAFVNILGDFDPRVASEMAWFRVMWLEFLTWYGGIPQAKKTFELGGDQGDPVTAVVDQMIAVQAELDYWGWPEPAVYSFEAYASTTWLNSYPSWWDAFDHLIDCAAHYVDYDASRLMVEEIGVHGCPTAPSYDGAGGANTFSAAFSAFLANRPDLPIGVWNYQEGCTGDPCLCDDQWGLLTMDGTAKQGWWVLPYFFTHPGSPPRLGGDANCDAMQDTFDIDPFLSAVSTPALWHQQYPGCNILNNDLNCDGFVDVFDIDRFVSCISGGDCGCP